MKPEDISAAARALGSIKSPRKTESSRKNAARASKSAYVEMELDEHGLRRA